MTTTSRRYSARVWITYNMADRRGWLFGLALILALVGLAAHFVYDAACPLLPASSGSSCALGSRPAVTGGEPSITHSLHTAAVTPAPFGLAAPLALLVPIRRLDLKSSPYSLPPHFQPPRIVQAS